MSIASGDIKFFASKNMTDTPDGGGGPTGVVIPDGASNAIFPDISELDRAIGRVNIRQVVLGVTTPDTDTYLGAHVIIAAPPNDPRVSVVMVKVDNLFANRDEMKRRIESYLAGGSSYPGYLFGNMLQGQSSIAIAQREGVPLPNIGDRLVLRKNFGLPGQVEQFVAVTSVSNLLRIFSDSAGDFLRNIVSLGLSDPLEADFDGFDAMRIDPSAEEIKARTSINEAVVANAASFYGAVPLAEPASIGDFTVRATTIRVPIVPSAQAETPIADASTNGMAYALVAAGGPVVQSVFANWSPSQSLFVGGSLLPGSVSIERDGITIIDKGGRLMQAGAEVGSIDYDNGVASLSVDVFGAGAGSHTITATPAATPQAAQRSLGIAITLQNRALNYVVTIVPPARRSLVAHYLVAGRWYTLREDGSGALRGLDASYGVGNLNRTTGTLQLTLGALPDVGSALILQWIDEVTSQALSNTTLRMSTRLYTPLNTSGAASDAPGARPIQPNKLKFTWNDGAAKSASDDGNGVITGDATGVVDYQRGVALLAPDALPAPGTVFTLKQENAPGVPASGAIAVTKTDMVWTTGAPVRTSTVGATIAAGTVAFDLQIVANGTATGLPAGAQLYQSRAHGDNGLRTSVSMKVNVTDDGTGNLKALGQTIGSVNYGSGVLSINPALFSTAAMTGWQALLVATVDGTGQNWLLMGGRLGDYAGAGFTFDADCTFNPFNTLVYIPGTASTDPIDPVSVTVDSYINRVLTLADGYTLQGVSFELAGGRLLAANTGVLLGSINPATGAGVPVGTVSAALGMLELTTWTPGTANALADWRAVQAPPVSGSGDISGNTKVMFRTATAPLRPGSFSLVGEMEDGTPINVTAGTNGKIDGARVKGTINVDNGVVELVFCSPVPTSLGTADLSYMGIAGVGVVDLDTARASTLRYNAVAYTYIPLDASIVGINSVRLPTDGLVPVHAAGRVAVVRNVQKLAPATVANGDTFDCGRTRLSKVRLLGHDGVAINAGWTVDLETGLGSITNVTGYSQPVTVEHSVEDTALVGDAQLSGHIRFTRPLTHNYPVEGTYVSSALLLGDMRARVSLKFDQMSWNGITWLDALDGDQALASYNDTLAPIEVTNEGALTERWALHFEVSGTSFRIVGENVGVIGTGSTGADCAPINPNTGAPYFTVRESGWGAGWVAGNVLRFNTVGAMASVPLVRVIQQGPESGTDCSFSVLARGDVDRP